MRILISNSVFLKQHHRLLVAGGGLNFENLLWHEKVTGVSYIQISSSKKQARSKIIKLHFSLRGIQGHS